jgi:dUTPase
MIPFKIKLLTGTAKAPTQENEGDLWDLYVDNFCGNFLKDINIPEINSDEYILKSGSRILIKTGIALELPLHLEAEISRISEQDQYGNIKQDIGINNYDMGWQFQKSDKDLIIKYAVADIRPRSGLALKYGISITNSPGTIDNSYRKEIGVILYNAGHEPYTISKGDKIAQMLIRPLYPSKMEIVENIEDTQRGGFGSTGK